jgi:acyl-coenzyme A thioesterase PaaI-like protein
MTKEFHKNCFACGKYSPIGLRLHYTLCGNTLTGEFRISDNYQGYDDIVHGGIIASILDCSMVHLFHKRDGLELKTAKLNITYRKSLPVNKTFVVTAIADYNARHFYKAKAQIKIGDMVFAEAEGFFRR